MSVKVATLSLKGKDMDNFGLELRISKNDKVRIDRVAEIKLNDAGNKLAAVVLTHGLNRIVDLDFGESALRHWNAYVHAVEVLDPTLKRMEDSRPQSSFDSNNVTSGPTK